MKTVKLSSFTQNPDNPQKYGEGEIAALVESIRKEPRTLGAATIAFCTDYTATNGASYAKRRVIFSDRGDVVIDPCAGSGSTLRAAAELGRRAFGFEIKKEFYNDAINKMLATIQPTFL